MLVGYFYGILMRLAIPEAVPKLAVGILVPLAVAAGVYLVGNIGRERGDYKYAFYGCILSYAIITYLTEDEAGNMYVAMFGAMSFQYKREYKKDVQPSSKTFRKRLQILSIGALVICALWCSFFYFNAEVTTDDGETIKLRDAVNHFFNSPVWLEFKDVLKQLFEEGHKNGWDRLYDDFVKALDPRGEQNAYRVLGLTENASHQEIRKRYKKLAIKWHPDRNPDNKDIAQKKFMEIQEAYEIIESIFGILVEIQTTMKSELNFIVKHRTYNSNKPLPLLGKFKAHVESKDKVITTTFYVTEGNPGNLLSFNSCVNLELIQVSNNINRLPTSDHPNTGKLMQRYPELFEDKIGQLKDYEVKLHIDPDVKPVAQPHRRVPFHLRAKVEEEINQLLDADVIEKVEGPTPWVSPIVVTPKPKTPDKIRLCVDMRAANTAIERERHITPTVDDIIGQIHGSSVFSKLDLRSGYHQLTLAPESRYITTFATHTGLYRYKRLSFGINAAAEVFQHAISQLLADIPGALNISDDVIVFGQTQNDHDETLEKTLKKFSDNHLTLNAKKCEFNKTSLEFFGFVFSDGGMKPDPKKVEDIQNLEPPTNVKELRSVLGMTGYSSRFIPDYATITAPPKRTDTQTRTVHGTGQRLTRKRLKLSRRNCNLHLHWHILTFLNQQK
ncbi:hypothetical protein QZH41_003823 [Actinostola sp. cb2023]|nr:hypothetical protein QZH41_003823 [Actinostola sp. cb2023]